jgi:hypothetical protein
MPLKGVCEGQGSYFGDMSVPVDVNLYPGFKLSCRRVKRCEGQECPSGRLIGRQFVDDAKNYPRSEHDKDSFRVAHKEDKYCFHRYASQ